MYTISNFITSKAFYKHLVYALLTLACILMVVYLWMSSYTDHGETILVPNLNGKSFKEAEKIIETNKLRIAIMDSVFDVKKPRGSIIEQNPTKGALVKENRTIYITVNAFKAPQVTIPNLKDASLRQAKAVLEVVGLEIGTITYKPDIAKNAVLHYSFMGQSIKSTMQVPFGSKIDLVVGDGLNSESIELPCLYGLSSSIAHNKLKELSLALGAEVYDNTVTDTAKAIVYKQTPNCAIRATINKGSTIDLYYTEDESKIPTIPTDSTALDETP